MNIAAKTGLLAMALALLLPAGNSSAAVAEFWQDSNAINYCQAFTPGPANTIRNRVVGSENVGSANVNVACDLASFYNGAEGNTAPTYLEAYFSNNTTADINITCSLLTGYQGDSGTYVVTKSVVVPAGATSDDGYSLSWDSEDNPEVGASDLGSDLVGINCVLPHGGVINDMYMSQDMDNGVDPPV